MQLSKRELQNLNGFLGGEANWDSDTRSALLLSDAGPRKSTRSKPTIIETPEPDLIARDTSLRKGNTPAGPRRKPKATTSESQLSVEKAGLALDQNVISSISTLSEPPSDLNLDDEEVPVPPAKRQKRNLPVVGRPGGSQRSGVILRLPFNDAENQRKFNDLDNAREAHLNDTDHATSDVHDGTEFRTDTETDDIDDESDYAPTPARRSTKRVQRIPSGSTTAVMRLQALKATLLRSPRVQKGPTPRTPFLNRSRKLGLVTPPATPNGIFSIEPLPFYEDRRESNAIDTSAVPVRRSLLKIGTQNIYVLTIFNRKKSEPRVTNCLLSQACVKFTKLLVGNQLSHHRHNFLKTCVDWRSIPTVNQPQLRNNIPWFCSNPSLFSNCKFELD